MFRILALSGGGFKGLFSARVLAAVENQTGRQIASSFEMIAGTSIGAIVALAAAAGVPMSKLVEKLRELGPSVFPEKRWPMSVLSGVFAPMYSTEKLRTFLDELFEDRTIGDLQAAVVVPSVNITTGRPKIFKTPHHQNFFRDKSVLISEVALASAAAPIFFPLATVGNEVFADGGLYATSPDLIAAHEAEIWLEVDRSDIHILSVGTLSTRFSLPSSAGTAFGVLKWFKKKRLLEVIFSSQQLLVEQMMEQRFQNRYFRIDTTPGHESSREMGLDVARARIHPMLLGLADDEAGKALNDPIVKQMLREPAAPLKMHNG
jgi:predicted acylesterase/phospholipase RssA